MSGFKRLVTVPARWLFQEIGDWVLGLTLFVGVIYLTGLADGSWVKALFILVSACAALIGVVMFLRRPSKGC